MRWVCAVLLVVSCRARQEPLPVVDAAGEAPLVQVDPSTVVAIDARERPPRTLIVLLHGLGANADDLRPIGERFAKALPDADVLLPNGIEPYDRGGGGRQWFSVRSVSELDRADRVRLAGRSVDAWIERCLAHRGLPRSRLVVAGFSQGAMLSMWLGVHHAPGAVVAFSGRYVDDDPSARTTTPMFVSHGSTDSVIPVVHAEEAKGLLTARGATVELFVEPGVPHTISPAALERGTAFLRRTLGG